MSNAVSHTITARMIIVRLMPTDSKLLAMPAKKSTVAKRTVVRTKLSPVWLARLATA